jgi:sulfur carrier protein ThiS
MKVFEYIISKGYLPEECFAVKNGKVLPDNAEIDEDVELIVFTVLG